MITESTSGIREFDLPDDEGRSTTQQVLSEMHPHGRLWYQHVQTLANPWFEAMSGITTCGATILPDIELLERQVSLGGPTRPHSLVRVGTSWSLQTSRHRRFGAPGV